jgi:hypothetical protein
MDKRITSKKSMICDHKELSMRLRQDLNELKKLSQNFGIKQTKKNIFHKIRGSAVIDKDIAFAMSHLHNKKIMTFRGQDIPYEYMTSKARPVKKSEYEDIINENRKRLTERIPQLTVEYHKVVHVKPKEDDIFDISLSSNESNHSIKSKRRKESVTFKPDTGNNINLLNDENINDKETLPFLKRSTIKARSSVMKNMSSSLKSISNFSKPVNLKGVPNLKIVHHKKKFSLFNSNDDLQFFNPLVNRKSIEARSIKLLSFDKRKIYGKIDRPNKKLSILGDTDIYSSVMSYDSNTLNLNSPEKENEEIKKPVMLNNQDEFFIQLDDRGGMQIVKTYIITPKNANGKINKENKLAIKTHKGNVDMKKLIDLNQSMSTKVVHNKSIFDSGMTRIFPSSRRIFNNSINSSKNEEKSEQQYIEEEIKLNNELKQKNLQTLNKYKLNKNMKIVNEVEGNKKKLKSIDKEIKEVLSNASNLYEKINKKIQDKINAIY